jgi:cell division protein FtsB
LSRTVRKKKHGWLIGFLFFLSILLLLSTGKRGFIQQFRISRRMNQLNRDIETLKKDKEKLEEEIEKLKTPEYTEKMAREKYGMAKKKEKVYRVIPEDNN